MKILITGNLGYVGNRFEDDTPRTENSPLNPPTAYARSKVFTELVGELKPSRFGWRSMALRGYSAQKRERGS